MGKIWYERCELELSPPRELTSNSDYFLFSLFLTELVLFRPHRLSGETGNFCNIWPICGDALFRGFGPRRNPAEIFSSRSKSSLTKYFRPRFRQFCPSSKLEKRQEFTRSLSKLVESKTFTHGAFHKKAPQKKGLFQPKFPCPESLWVFLRT